jgi:hypothetical protein
VLDLFLKDFRRFIMKKLVFIGLLLSIASFITQAAIIKICPDPKTSSLREGIPPEPWTLNPFSSNRLTVDETTQFAKANILAFGRRGLGVVCFYENKMGIYSIWWEVLVKLPAQQDYNWIDTAGGFVCAGPIESCQFSVAPNGVK